MIRFFFLIERLHETRPKPKQHVRSCYNGFICNHVEDCFSHYFTKTAGLLLVYFLIHGTLFKNTNLGILNKLSLLIF